MSCPLTRSLSRASCKQVHRLDGLLMSTVAVDEYEIAEYVVQQYILALFHANNVIGKLVAFGRKACPGKHFVIATQVGLHDRVDTRNVPWGIICEDDSDWSEVDWEPYNERTHILVHIRVFYGSEDNMQLAKLNIFPRIDGRHNDLSKDN